MAQGAHARGGDGVAAVRLWKMITARGDLLGQGAVLCCCVESTINELIKGLKIVQQHWANRLFSIPDKCRVGPERCKQEGEEQMDQRKHRRRASENRH